APRKRTKAAPRKRTKTASRPPSKQNAPLKPSGLVEDIIAKSAKGIGIDELKKKTGFEKTRLYTIVHRLKARKKIKNKEHGIYVKT
ncbi:MAG: hypothetical protein GY866_14470, partial [Proteobacteria bacterium]|nr:hypothetical protein [Pseudomonadota bacterium]